MENKQVIAPFFNVFKNLKSHEIYIILEIG